MISGQVHSLSPNSSSINLQNLPPNKYMPSMLQFLSIILDNGFYVCSNLFLCFNNGLVNEKWRTEWN